MRRKRKEILIDKLHRTAVMVAGGIGAFLFLMGAAAFDSEGSLPAVLVVLGIAGMAIVALHSDSMYWGDDDE